MLDIRSREFAASTRQSLTIDSIATASGNAWLNSRYSRTFSKASWMTERIRGRWAVSISLVVPETNMRSVSTGYTGCGFGAMLGTSLAATSVMTWGAALVTTWGAALVTTWGTALVTTLGTVTTLGMELGTTLGVVFRTTLGTLSTCI